MLKCKLRALFALIAAVALLGTITHVGSDSNGTGNGGSSMVVTTAQTPAPGDAVMLAFWRVSGGITSLPTGWSCVAANLGTQNNVSWCTTTADGTTNSWTFPINATGPWCWSAMELSQSPSLTINGAGFQNAANTATGTSFTSAIGPSSLTLSPALPLMYAVAYNSSGVTVSTPSGFTRTSSPVCNGNTGEFGYGPMQTGGYTATFVFSGTVNGTDVYDATQAVATPSPSPPPCATYKTMTGVDC